MMVSGIYRVAPTSAFLSQLMKGITQRYNQEIINQALVILPTKESCQRFKAYHQYDCKVIALGDVNTLYRLYGRGLLQPIPPLYRQFLLQKWLIEEAGISNPSAPLVYSLLDVLDDFYINQQPLERLLTIIPEIDGKSEFCAKDFPWSKAKKSTNSGPILDFLAEGPGERLHEKFRVSVDFRYKIGEWADHWHLTLGRLQQLVQHWPNLLAAENYGETILVQQALFNRLCQTWHKTPPDYPIIIAGTRGSRPATKELIKVVAKLPQGAVILPPYDPMMIEEEPLPMSHPAWALQDLLQALEVQGKEIPLWHLEDPEERLHEKFWVSADFRCILREVMRPATTTDQWCQVQSKDKSNIPPWSLITCPNQQKEAAIIIQLAQDHQHKGRVAIVTADPQLSEAITMLAKVRNLLLHSSQKTHLGQSKIGEVLHRFCHCWEQDFMPIAFLGLMQHPSVQLTVEKDQWQKWLCDLNQHLRRPKPATGWQALKSCLQDNKEPLNIKIIQKLDVLWSDFSSGSLLGGQWLTYLVQTLRVLCRTASWVEEGGEAICQTIEKLRRFVTPTRSKDQVQMLLYQALCHTPWPEDQSKAQSAEKQSIDLLTPSQARLLDYDVWILGGCQEGVWPKVAEGSLWLNQTMRFYCGLPPQEWVMGHAAHDFCWPLWHGQKVFITTHQQSDDTYCPSSRWVRRLEFVLNQYGWLDHVQQNLSQGLQRQPTKATKPPAPRPSVLARPTTFSISDVCRWRLNPYHFYAEKILKLKPLELLESDPDRSDYGQKLHQVLESFVRTYPQQLPEDAETILLDTGRQVLHDFVDKPSLWQLWWPRFCQIAQWFVQHETTHRQLSKVVGVEVPAHITFKIDQISFTLKGVIDRIDQDHEGTLHVIDYKTGSIPATRDMVLGMTPQLPLEACLVKNKNNPHPIHLDYWQLQGTYEGGQVHSMSHQGILLAEQALEGLEAMVTAFSQPQTPYLAHPFSDWRPFASPYDHLARVDAWWWSIQDGAEL